MVVMVVRSMAGVSTMLPMVPDWFPRSPIRRSVGRFSTCGHRPGRNPPSRFYALRTHIVVSAAYRPFAQGVFYNALVSVADHLQCLLRSRGHVCSAELLLQEGKFLVHSYQNFEIGLPFIIYRLTIYQKWQAAFKVYHITIKDKTKDCRLYYLSILRYNLLMQKIFFFWELHKWKLCQDTKFFLTHSEFMQPSDRNNVRLQ